MENGENTEGQGYSAAPTQQQSASWSNHGANLPPEMQPKSSENQIPIYYNTPSDAAASSVPAHYPQPQKSPAIPQASAPNPTSQSFPDMYRYHQHTPSPGPAVRMTHRMPGPYPPTQGWPATNAPVSAHSQYMTSPDRGRYNSPRPSYPGYDPNKPYPHPPLPAHPNQGPWQRVPYPSHQPGYTDPTRAARLGQPDIAGPIVPAGLQPLQLNNNNAALMQHQHTPMLVPNPHYNQNRVQQHGIQPSMSEKSSELPKGDMTPQRPTPDGSIYSPASTNPSTPNYYSTQSPHPQHGNVGPMHHQVGLNSPSVSPYPTNPGTPGSIKGKTRGNKSYQCPKCVKVFRRGDHLKRHLLSVHDHEHPYQCGECGKGFASVPALLKHAKSLHIGNLAKGLMCLRCQVTFSTFQEIEAHAGSLHVQDDEMYMQNINTSSKQHCCSSCAKSFTSAANLKRHMQLLHRSKDDSKMYCRECGKGFMRIDMMRKHIEKLHSGNPNAMPDELDDAETLSQAHSSESESRGLSADTDESSLSAPPVNASWCGYPTPTAPQHLDSRPSSHGHAAVAPPQSSVPHPPFPQQGSNGSEQQLGSENGAAAVPPQPPMAPRVVPPPAVSGPEQNGKGAQVAQSRHVNVVQSTEHAIPRQTQHQLSEANAMVTRALERAQPEKIEPKSVSEALSMAMRALSDSNYETPGFEMYPYPTAPQSIQPLMQQQRVYSNPQQLMMPQHRNGVAPNINGHGSSSGMPMYTNIHQNYDFSSRYGGNFLMTMPPPPGSATTDLPPQPITAGTPEAPQLSRLLQGGGGGVKIPTVINNNNNSNVLRDRQLPQINTTPSLSKRTAGAVDDVGTSGEFGQPQPEEKVDLSCKLCKTEYMSIENLMMHIEGVHLKQNPHECCICNKHFAQAGNVKRHIRFVHLRERPFRCKDCSCTFDRLCYLQRHMRTHLQLSEENQEFNPLKPCSCPECGKRCLTAHHLRGHMQRKHFAKNKQNYEQFLAKYGHLEALGTGPGAISHHSKGRRGRKRKDAGRDANADPGAYIEHNRSFSDPVQNSSSMPDSSIQSNSLSTLPRYQCPPPQNIPPAMQFPASTCTPPLQQHILDHQSQMRMTMSASNQELMTSLPSIGSSLLTTATLVNDAEAQNYSMNGAFTNTTISAAIEVPPIHQLLETWGSKRRVKSRLPRFKGHRKCGKFLSFRCTRCVFKSFSTLAMLKSHLAVVHKTFPKRHVCLKCGASFAKRRFLLSHCSAIHKVKAKSKTSNFAVDSPAELLAHIPSATPPLYQAQQVAPGYTHNSGYYQPSNLPYYGYNPNSPAMVPSPNVQTAYATPTHYVASHIPLIQT